jgi:hypothetical protein
MQAKAMKRWSGFMVLSITGRVAEFLEIGAFGFALTRREETPTQAQRPGTQDAWIANHDAMPG